MKFKYDLDGFIIIDAKDEESAQAIREKIGYYVQTQLRSLQANAEVAHWSICMPKSQEIKEDSNKIKEETNKNIDVNIFR